MHEVTPTVRDPRPAARVGYHMGKGLATTFTMADCRDFGRGFLLSPIHYPSRHPSERWGPALAAKYSMPQSPTSVASESI